MNVNKLFEMQAQLDAHIEREHPRRDGEDRTKSNKPISRRIKSTTSAKRTDTEVIS